MPISVKTVYTKQLLRAYRLYIMLRSAAVWIPIGIYACFSVISLFCSVWLGFRYTPVNLFAAITTLLLLYKIFVSFVLPCIITGRDPLLNDVVEYTFDEQALIAHSISSTCGEEHVILPYTHLLRVVHTPSGQLYLFIQKNTAHLADTTAWTDEQRETVLRILKQALGDDKIR